MGKVTKEFEWSFWVSMLFLITAVVVLFSMQRAEAAVFSVRVDASSAAIPQAFSTSSASKVISGVPNVRTIIVDNRTEGEVAINCGSGANTAPTSNTANIYVGGNSQVAIDNAYLNTTCYVKSMTGSNISSGILVLMLIGG